MILKDKIILVTGGSGLIGREIVSDIRRQGGIAINADINVDTCLEKVPIIWISQMIYQFTAWYLWSKKRLAG